MTLPVIHRPFPTALAALAALGVAAVLSACGATNTTDGADPGTPASGPWHYTDDRGAEIELDQQPTRIAAFADQALALLSYGIEPVAIFGRVDVASDPRFEDYDLSGIEIVGNAYGEIDLDKLAETAPDLVVTGIYPTDRKGTLDLEGPLYGLADVEQQKQIDKFTDLAAIKIGGEGLQVVESTTALAEALGADEEVVADAKQDFEEARDELAAAAEEHPDIEVTQMYAAADGVYVVKVGDEPETQMYAEFGANFTDLNPDGKYYWDVYSWENAAKMMTGDVLLVNVEGFGEDDLAKQPTFAQDPALRAGQVHSWNGAAMDYASQAEQMEQLAEIIEDAKDVV